METARVPFFVPLFNPLAHRLLRAGLPLGPNALLTVRGRKSGQPRTTPVAVVEINGRRWIIGTFGETNWVQNLRAAREATIAIKRQPIAVTARELSVEDRERFFGEVLAPFVRRIPLGIGRALLRSLGATEVIDDPAGSAPRHPVFELVPKDQRSVRDDLRAANQ
jgi:deazaflavin-dependent oxidoreductase (nitroreductase family)